MSSNLWGRQKFPLPMAIGHCPPSFWLSTTNFKRQDLTQIRFTGCQVVSEAGKTSQWAASLAGRWNQLPCSPHRAGQVRNIFSSGFSKKSSISLWKPPARYELNSGSPLVAQGYLDQVWNYTLWILSCEDLSCRQWRLMMTSHLSELREACARWFARNNNYHLKIARDKNLKYWRRTSVIGVSHQTTK